MLFLIGVDPLRDVPDADLVRRALDNVPVKVVQSLELGSLERYADAFLPASAFLEKDGHVSTWEGRGQRLRAIRGRDGISLADWEIFASMALACGGDLGFETLDELHEEMGRLLGARERGGTDGIGAPGAGSGTAGRPGAERLRRGDRRRSPTPNGRAATRAPRLEVDRAHERSRREPARGRGRPTETISCSSRTRCSSTRDGSPRGPTS